MSLLRYGIKEAALEIGLSEPKLREFLKGKKLPCHKFVMRVYFTEEDMQAIMAAAAIAAEAPLDPYEGQMILDARKARKGGRL